MKLNKLVPAISLGTLLLAGCSQEQVVDVEDVNLCRAAISTAFSKPLDIINGNPSSGGTHLVSYI